MEKKISKNKCSYSDKCTIYKGENLTNPDSLILHRNVFCIRGERGWKNCQHYLDFESNTTSTDDTL